MSTCGQCTKSRFEPGRIHVLKNLQGRCERFSVCR